MLINFALFDLRHKSHKMNSKLHPESLMMSYGYKPELSEGAIKPPIFLTSTFVFKTAEEGKSFFEVAYGLREKEKSEELGLIYSRINNPNLEILENRLCLWDKAEECAVFESGMSAISTVLLEFLKPGNLLLYSLPTYGGTDHLINHYLKDTGVHSIGIRADQSKEEIIQLVQESGLEQHLSMIFLETPANPTNDLFDIAMCKEITEYFQSEDKLIPIAVDNTFMGPLWANPLQHGADIVIYSATKYIGGHSDLIAGGVLGNSSIIKRVKGLRTFLGNMASPHTCWLLLRSLETLKVRMDQQMKNAVKVADLISRHPAVDKLYYLGNLDKSSKMYEIFKREYNSPGAMIAFQVKGGEKEAFIFLNQLKLIKLAVSLGSTESLAQHPSTMTHAGMCPITKQKMGITESLVRLSIGIENVNDLRDDIKNALDTIPSSMIEKPSTPNEVLYRNVI